MCAQMNTYSESGLLMRYAFTSSSPLLVDVGAHQGSFSIAFAGMGWEIIAFEPELKNYRALQANLAEYKNAKCIQKGVSDLTAEKIPFYVSKEHYGIHSLKPWHGTHQFGYMIESIRLDEYLSENQVAEVTLLKIDTEGSDYWALQSFDFNQYRPEAVIVEFDDQRTSGFYGYTHHEVVRYMVERGFSAFVSEWEPIKEYGREGVIGDSHVWIQCLPYNANHSPFWGNLIFLPEADKGKFENALNHYIVECNSRP